MLATIRMTHKGNNTVQGSLLSSCHYSMGLVRERARDPLAILPIQFASLTTLRNPISRLLWTARRRPKKGIIEPAIQC